jgi:transposase
MQITTVGLDLAKRVSQVHGVDAGGLVVMRRKLQRAEVTAFFADLPSCRPKKSWAGTSTAARPRPIRSMIRASA